MPIQADAVDATYKDGVLTVHLPKGRDGKAAQSAVKDGRIAACQTGNTQLEAG